MTLSDHHINEFISLYEKHYGVVLERDKAIEKGMQLCRFIEIVAFEPKDTEGYGKVQTRLLNS